MTKREANQYGVAALAFLGDAVYERLVRERIVIKANMPAAKLHNEAIKYVCCEFQSAAIEKIFDRLAEEEQAIYKRGRNADGVTPPKHSSAQDYRRATGLECLFGYLELSGERGRIDELFGMICEDTEIQ